MEDYKKLVERLREDPKDSRKAVLSIYDLCVDAATAIENLSYRLDMAQGERDAVTRHMIELEQDVCRLKSRLAAYEDTGLEPEDIISAVDMSKIACALHELNAYKDLGPIDHIRDLIEAEQAGRLVLLPFIPHSTMLNLSDPENLEVMEDVRLYVAWKSPSGIVFNSPYSIFLQNIEKGYIKPDIEDAEAVLKGGEG